MVDDEEDDDNNNNNNNINNNNNSHNNNNGILLLSFHYNNKIREKESCDTRHITSSCWAAKHWPALPTSTTPPLPHCVLQQISSLWSGHCPGWQTGLQLAKSSTDYPWIRITEWLLYYRGIKCNWKLMLSGWVRLVTDRVKSCFDVVGMSGCVSVSHWFTEQDVQNYKQYLAAICYVRSVCKTLL